MQPHFYRISNAISFTLAFYGSDKIKDHMFILAGNTTNSKYKLEWYDFMFEAHERMENEILETIQTRNHNTQVYLFENLKGWLEDDRITGVNIPLIDRVIDEYNTATYQEYENKIENKVKEFQKNPYFHLGHNEEYEHEIKTGIYFGAGLKYSYKEKKINRKYYCNESKPELIDTEYREGYFELINKLLISFRSVVSKYVAQYDKGLFKAYDVVYLQSTPVLLPPSEDIKSLPEPNKKLKLNLTVEQVAFLFRLLKDEKLIEASNNIEIQEFISSHISTKRTGIKPISVAKLGIAFSSPEADNARTIAKHLKAMWEAAVKI